MRGTRFGAGTPLITKTNEILATARPDDKTAYDFTLPANAQSSSRFTTE